VKGELVAPPRETIFSILPLKSIFCSAAELNQRRCSGASQNLASISLTLMIVIFLMARVLRVQSSEMAVAGLGRVLSNIADATSAEA
jgi:hypothetical protein